LQCEVCGREILRKPQRVIIEGAKMITCEDCAKLGSDYWLPEPTESKRFQPKPKERKSPLASTSKPAKSTVLESTDLDLSTMENIEIVDGFGQMIRRAREKLGLTIEDLAKKIGEKESVMRKVESEKIVPDIRLAAKIEHALKIKLLVKQHSLDASLDKPKGSKDKRNLTLGEIVHLKIDE